MLMCNHYQTMEAAVARGLKSQVSVLITACRASQTAMGYQAQGSSVTLSILLPHCFYAGTLILGCDAKSSSRHTVQNSFLFVTNNFKDTVSAVGL